MHYMVKEVADIVGVSVRTLHHYDRIGLLKPASVSPAGYRLYTDNDLIKLQQIMFFKELDFNLREIKNIINNPNYDQKHALEIHKDLLMKKKHRLEELIITIENTLSSIKGGLDMNKKKMFDAFDMNQIEEHKKKYSEEVRQKYCKETVDECERKTSGYKKEDWNRISGKSDEIFKRISGLMDKGPHDPQVQEAVGEYRQFINDNFYTCTLEIFRGLGDLYVNDERLTQNIDKYGYGLANFLKEAMHIFCDNAQK